MSFVLDASVTLAWCFEDEGGDFALRVLDALRTSEAVVASLWPLEIANGLLRPPNSGHPRIRLLASSESTVSPASAWRRPSSTFARK